MRRALVLAALLGLALVPAARGTEPAPAAVEIGKVGLTATVAGRAALLVPVHYPIQLLGQRVELRVFLRLPGLRGASAWTVRTRAADGPRRLPERRRRFTFVHQLDLGPRLTRAVEGAHGRPLVRVEAPGALDINRDGATELDSSDEAVQALRRGVAASLCASVPLQRARPGESIRVELPACGGAVHWRVAGPPPSGSATIRGGALVYRSAARFRGTVSIELRGRPHGAGGVAEAPVEIVVEPHQGTVARAIGDSFTAGFGYYDDGRPMPAANLPECEPQPRGYADACSSNSSVRSSDAGSVAYAPDYGLANNVSWAAQWANGHGVSNYENLAVSGSEASDWAPGGALYPTTQQVEAEAPDYILMTVGGNPLLPDLRGKLESLYRELVDNTGATVYLMQYPLSTPAPAPPYDASQIAMLNREITAAAAVSPSRLHVIAPPGLDGGADISAVYPFPSPAGYAQMAAQVPAP